MEYTTWIFALFLIVTLLLYYLVPKKARWIVLLTASCFYYLLNSSVLIVCLLITTVSIYFCGLQIGKINNKFKEQKKGDITKEEKKLLKAKAAKGKKAVVVVSIVINFGLLLFLKYFNFFSDMGGSIIGIFNPQFSAMHLSLAMPMGISFYTLQAVSYVIDVYRGKIKPDRNIGRMTLFLMFFPQIMEGPIGRYGDLAPQLYQGHSFDYKKFTYGMQLLLWGLFKKLVIANRAGIFADSVFKSPDNYGGITSVAAMLIYTLQLYCDFSGCIEIVTGVAQLFGVDLAENFRRPFFSLSIQEFWRRWHMTLGSWLRDYVFYPISFSKFFMKLSKKTKEKLNAYWARIIPMAFSMIFVWLGMGMWHGSGIKYILYGLYYYIIIMLGVMCEPLSRKVLAWLHIKSESWGYKLFQMLRTFVLVCIGMTIFRANEFTDAMQMIGSIFTSNFLSGITTGALWKSFGIYRGDFLVLIVGTLILLAVGIIQEKGIHIRDFVAKRNIVLRWAIYYAGMFTVLIFGAYGVGYSIADMIYAQF